MIAFCNDNLKTTIDPEPGTVEPGSPDLFNYAYVDLTGHGNIYFSEAETANLRTYLEGGGFCKSPITMELISLSGAK